MSRRALTYVVLLLVALGFAVRVAAIFRLRSFETWQRAGAMEHRAVAHSLLRGTGFSAGGFDYYGPSSVQSPPYPLLLAGLFAVFGEDSSAAYYEAMVINAAAGGMTVWLVYLLVRTLGGSQVTGLIAASLFAVWPSQVYLVTYTQAIALITAGLCGSMILFQRAVSSGRATPWIGFSLTGTLAALTEPVLLPAMALTGILILFWRTLPLGLRIRNAAILLITAIIVIGPWTFRNRQVHGAWVPIKSTFWVNLWKGNNDFATGTDRLPMKDSHAGRLREGIYSLDDEHARDPEADSERQYNRLTEVQLARLNGKPEAQREQVFKEIVTQWIAEHPAHYARLCMVRLGKTLWIDWDNPKSWNAIFIASRIALLLLSAAGLVVAMRQRWSLLFPAMVAGLCLLTYMLTITAARFSLPFEPLQLCLAAAMISALIARFRARAMPSEAHRISQ